MSATTAGSRGLHYTAESPLVDFDGGINSSPRHERPPDEGPNLVRHGVGRKYFGLISEPEIADNK